MKIPLRLGSGDSSAAATLPDLSPSPAGDYTSPSITVDSKGRVIAATNGTSGGTPEFLPVSVFTAGAHPLGNYTYGRQYGALKELTVTGIKFRAYADWGTVTVKLRRNGTVLASKSTSTGAAGVFTVTFDTPVSISAGQSFTVSAYDGGTKYVTGTPVTADTWLDSCPFPANNGKALAVPPHCRYASGDNDPTSTDSNNRCPIEAVFG